MPKRTLTKVFVTRFGNNVLRNGGQWMKFVLRNKKKSAECSVCGEGIVKVEFYIFDEESQERYCLKLSCIEYSDI